MPSSLKPGFSDYALLVALAAIYGFSFLATKVAVQEIPAVTVTFARLAGAAVLLLPLLYFTRDSIAELLPHWKLLMLVALFGNAFPFWFIAWGQEQVDAGLTAILMAIMPLITLVLAHFFTQEEKLNRYKVIGFLLGLIGVMYLIGFNKLASLGSETVRQYAIMAGATCYAIHAILFKRLTNLPRKPIVVVVLTLSALVLLPVVLFVDQPWELDPSADGLAALLFLAAIPTALGTIMLFAIIGRQGASFLSQINFLVPVFGVLWAVLLINEVLPPNAFVALALILAGIAIARINSTKIQMEQKS